jgi:hypothetical protein
VSDWYEAEEPTRLGMVAELQRIKRRCIVRPIPVLLLATLITAAVTFKFAKKPRLFEARVVLAMVEGSLSSKSSTIPFDTLKEYVAQVLLPDGKLLDVIEKHNLYPLRKKLGAQYAIDELRSQIEIEIWKNSFVFYDDADANAQKSARVGITVADNDPDLAYVIAKDLADIAIASHEKAQKEVSDALSKEMTSMRESMAQRLEDLANQRATREAALEDARRKFNNTVAAAQFIELAAITAEEKKLNAEFSAIVSSPDALADRVTAAGLDTRLSIVEERHPEKSEPSGLVLAMIIVVIGTGALLGSALIVGAFDSRVHEVDDVTRLGLPVLGHVPGFQGDDVGSLEARGATRARVPSFLRWRSQR